MIPILIDVAKIMDDLFWQEAYGDKQALMASLDDEAAKGFAEINYGPWDRLGNNAPFIDGVGEKPLGAQYYPADMTKEEFETWRMRAYSCLRHYPFDVQLDMLYEDQVCLNRLSFPHSLHT